MPRKGPRDLAAKEACSRTRDSPQDEGSCALLGVMCSFAMEVNSNVFIARHGPWLFHPKTNRWGKSVEDPHFAGFPLYFFSKHSKR